MADSIRVRSPQPQRCCCLSLPVYHSRWVSDEVPAVRLSTHSDRIRRRLLAGTRILPTSKWIRLLIAVISARWSHSVCPLTLSLQTTLPSTVGCMTMSSVCPQTAKLECRASCAASPMVQIVLSNARLHLHRHLRHLQAARIVPRWSPRISCSCRK